MNNHLRDLFHFFYEYGGEIPYGFLHSRRSRHERPEDLKTKNLGGIPPSKGAMLGPHEIACG